MTNETAQPNSNAWDNNDSSTNKQPVKKEVENAWDSSAAEVAPTSENPWGQNDTDNQNKTNQAVSHSNDAWGGNQSET